MMGDPVERWYAKAVSARPDGPLVFYADYAALSDKVRELEAEVAHERDMRIEAENDRDRYIEGKVLAEHRAEAAEARLAPEGVAVANCCHCGRIVDTRETKHGGDAFGAQLNDGRWTCSPECWDAIVEPNALYAHPASDTALREALEAAGCTSDDGSMVIAPTAKVLAALNPTSDGAKS
jgi:hypothetical protein